MSTAALRLCPSTDSDSRARARELAAEMATMTLRDRLTLIERATQGRIVFTTGFGLEGQVLAHALSAIGSSAEWTTIDTGRLFPETLDVWAATEARFGRMIRGVAPGAAAVEALTARDGAHGFRASVEAREACCEVRKVEPLGRILEGAAAWITGLRAGQSEARGETLLAAWDAQKAVFKFAPLADWSADQVSAYVAMHQLPYNALHDRGFPSIGCAPCTRAVRVGESERAGRWWWEASDKECGLHRRVAA